VLAELGVSPADEAVYRALVVSPHKGTEEIAAAAGLTPEDVMLALRSLAQRELVSEDAEGQWVPVPPEQALELLIAREEEALAARRASLERTRAVIPDIVADYVDVRRAYVSDRVELLTDPTLVRSRLFQLTSQARVSAWSISPGGALSPEAVAASLPLDRELAERGVECRMVVGSESLGVEHWDAYLREIADLGHQVRSSASAFYRAIVIDGEYAVVPATGETRPGAYVLRGEALAAPVVALFEEVWSRSVPVTAQLPTDTSGPFTQARLRQVAHLMSLGLKDETVARRLGVSVRTVRRLIQATLAELGADGRFQAGVQAVQRGWVAVDAPHED
jgi:DNA-binding CsgD family transcriptional regulator/DNA-binding transcriptional ArsR family regulator